MKKQNKVGPQTRKAKAVHATWLFPTLAVLSIVAGVQAASQYFAYLYHYQSALGYNIMYIYPPWSIVVWYLKWPEYHSFFLKPGSVGVLVAGTGLLAIAIAKVLNMNSSRSNEYLHGSARWAEKKDIESAGLLEKKGGGDAVYVGGWEDKSGKLHYLRHSGPEHILCYAPTRSGKGVGLVVPTLLSWSHSAVVTDLKGELWSLTAGWRQEHAHNKVLRFEPAALNGCILWNPLDELRVGTEFEVGDVQNLAALIVDPDGKGIESHWQKTAFALLVGLILHVAYRNRNEGTPASLPEVDRMLSDPERGVADLWVEMATYNHVDGHNHLAVGSAARDMMDRPDEEAGSVLSTAKSYLALYRDPVVARNISASQFRIRDLMHHSDPVSLYIITQPNDKARLRPLVRIMVNMIVRLLADKMEFEKGRPVVRYKHRLLMMLDEFPSLGRLEIMQESLAFVAGYGIKCYLICQDINQLKSRETGYGHDEQITSNCHVQNAFPPNRIETAEHLSRLTGQATVIKEQITTSGRRSSAIMGQVSRSLQEVQRPLLTPDECLRMPGPIKDSQGNIKKAGDMVVYVAGYPAIYGKQILYFQDSTFQARAAVDAPAGSDILTSSKSDDNSQGISLDD